MISLSQAETSFTLSALSLSDVTYKKLAETGFVEHLNLIMNENGWSVAKFKDRLGEQLIQVS